MLYRTNKKGFVPVVAGFMALAMTTFGATSNLVWAQDKAAGDSKPLTTWFKLCDKFKFVKAQDPKEKDSKKEPAGEQKEVCMTQYEALHSLTGRPVISVMVRKVQDQEKDHLVVLIPVGMLLQAGVLLRVDGQPLTMAEDKTDGKQKPLPIPYTICTLAGCFAETIVTPEIVAKMKKGKNFEVAALNSAQKPVGFKVPLTGFGPALDGAPLDNAKYNQEREKLFAEIGKRREEYMKKMKEQQKSGSAQQTNQKNKQQ